MKEWSNNEAVEIIKTILMEETNEDTLSDKDCEELACKIVAVLEAGEYENKKEIGDRAPNVE